MTAVAKRYEETRDECEWEDFLSSGRPVCIHFAAKYIPAEEYEWGYGSPAHWEDIHLDIYCRETHDLLAPGLDYTRQDTLELESEGMRRLREDIFG